MMVIGNDVIFQGGEYKQLKNLPVQIICAATVSNRNYVTKLTFGK